MKTYKWVVEFEVDETWVADGFEITADSATEMLERSLPYAYETERHARVIKSSTPNAIAKAQGYSSARHRRQAESPKGAK